jgi:hypothetical protein
LAVPPTLPAEEQKAKEILARHSDKSWTLCDAISFAVLEARHVTRARHATATRRILIVELDTMS